MGLLVTVLVLSWLLVGFGCWLGYQLVRQNGRILLHLEGLAKRLAAGLAGPPAAGRPAPAHPEGLPLGAPAPEFELPDLAGERQTLAAFHGRKTLLIFFNPGCGFCSQMASDLARLPVDGAGGRPVPLVITTGDLERNRQLVAEHAIRCPVLVDESRDTASRYRAHGTPTGYLLDEEGRIISGLAIGAQALLDLADGKLPVPALPPANRPHHGPAVGSRDLSNSRIERNGLQPGTPAPDFRLPALDGGDLSLSEFRGRPVLLVFSDPHCGPCEALMPRLEAFHRASQPLQVLLVSRGEVAENQAKAQQHRLTFPIMLQKKWEVSKDYALFATPIAYLIDEEGVIAAEAATGPDPILELAERAARGDRRPPGAQELALAAPGSNGKQPGPQAAAEVASGKR